MWDFFTNLWSGVVEIVDICVDYVKNAAGLVRDTTTSGWKFTGECAKAAWVSCKATWPISKAKAILGGFLALIGVACIGLSMGVVTLGVAGLMFVVFPVIAWKLLTLLAYLIGAVVVVGAILFAPIAIFFGGAYILLNMKANSDISKVFSQAEASV